MFRAFFVTSLVILVSAAGTFGAWKALEGDDSGGAAGVSASSAGQIGISLDELLNDPQALANDEPLSQATFQDLSEVIGLPASQIEQDLQSGLVDKALLRVRYLAGRTNPVDLRIPLPDDIRQEIDAIYPVFAAEQLSVTDGPSGVYYCRAAGDVVVRDGQVVDAFRWSPTDQTYLVGQAVHAAKADGVTSPDVVPADPSGRLEASYEGPVHFDTGGNLVAGWAVCRRLE